MNQNISNSLNSNNQINLNDCFNSILVHFKIICDSLNNNNQITINQNDIDVISQKILDLRDSLNNNSINTRDFDVISQYLHRICNSLNQNNINIINPKDFFRITQKLYVISNSLTNKNNIINPDNFDVIVIHLKKIRDDLNNNNQITINPNDFDVISQKILDVRDSLNNNYDRAKDFLEIYQIYRDHIKHEDTLGNQRLSFFIASQSFLFFPYFSVLKDYERNGFNDYDSYLLISICILGLVTSCLTEASVRGFVMASSAINRIWRTKYINKNGYIEPQKYDNKVKLKVPQSWFSPDYGKIEPTSKLSERSNVAFLKLFDDKMKILPNVRYENDSKWINWKISKLSNNIPRWFMVIWIILLFVLPNRVLKSKFDTDKEFTSQITSIIVDNNEKFVNQLKTPHNKIVNSYQEEIINQKESYKQERKEFIVLLLNKKYSSNEETSNEIEKSIDNLAEKLLENSNKMILKYIDESENLVELNRRLSEE